MLTKLQLLILSHLIYLNIELTPDTEDLELDLELHFYVSINDIFL